MCYSELAYCQNSPNLRRSDSRAWHAIGEDGVFKGFVFSRWAIPRHLISGRLRLTRMGSARLQPATFHGLRKYRITPFNYVSCLVTISVGENYFTNVCKWNERKATKSIYHSSVSSAKKMSNFHFIDYRFQRYHRSVYEAKNSPYCTKFNDYQSDMLNFLIFWY